MSRQKKKDDPDKPKRRARGEGTVIERADGRYVARVPLGGGKRKEEYYDTKQEAERAKRRMLNERDAGKLVVERDQTLEEYLSYWLGIRRSKLEPTTYITYRRFLTAYVIPVLGGIKLRKLSGDMFQSLYADLLEDRDFSPNTVYYIHAILNKALNDAVRWKKVAFNAVKDADAPKTRKRPMAIVGREQAKKLIELTNSVRMRCILHMALLAIRRGELLALRWSDIDFEKAELHVEHTLSYIRDPDTGRCRFFETDTKTEAGRRVINLPRFAVDVLCEYRVYQLKLRASSSQWQEKDLVFSTMDGGYIEPQYVYNTFQALLDRAGLPDMRFHDLRHSAISIWLAMGISPKVVQELAGHSDIRVTMNVYGHVFPGAHGRAMDDYDQWFRDTDPPSNR